MAIQDWNAEIDDRLERLITWTAEQIMAEMPWLSEQRAFSAATRRVRARIVEKRFAPVPVDAE